MSARPLVGVYASADKTQAHVSLPAVFTSPIRSDIINDVFTRMSKNKRQPYAVSKYAGHQHSAESWGTGRAVSRIPRISGGGTSRAGQGAFGNMCRKGRMFAPTKIWRRWHRKINVNEKRFATCSALAASALPALVMARGHKIEQVPEVPLVVDASALAAVDKTSKALSLLKTLNAYEDVQHVKDSRGLRAGKGKSRNRRYVQRRGPLVIFHEKAPLVKAFRNIPGVELCNVKNLNLLQLAPGGHLGRFCIWTKDAFQQLDTVYGTHNTPSAVKNGFVLPRAPVQNADISRIINSQEIQSALKEKIPQNKEGLRKKNPLKNFNFLVRLNPYAQTVKRREVVTQEKRIKAKAALVEAKRKGVKQTPKKGAKKIPTNTQFKKVLLSN